MYCLSPPMEEVPQGDWFCPNCIAAANDAEDIGFNSGKTFTVDEFRSHCEAFDASFWGSKEAAAAASIPDIEEAFWRMVEEGSGKAVDVHYGADVDTSTHGSAFPTTWDEDHGKGREGAADAAAEHPWNLNNLPRLGGDREHCSLLRQVKDHIPGVLVPWLYVGSTFSSFCWHFEDHMLYSANYNHAGAAKTWYGVPGSAADAFEECFKQAMPDLFAAQPDLLLQLVTMLSPSLLVNDGVPVYRTDQRAGEFVVTFPRSYHAGFNTGFNCAEAVNFAPPDWLRFGVEGVERYRFYRKPSVLCHDELLCVAAADSPSAEVARWLVGDLKRLCNEERTAREQLMADGVVRSRRYAPKKLAAAAAAAKLARDAAESSRRMSTTPGDGDDEAVGDAARATKAAMEAALDPLDAAESLLPHANANGAYDRECTICRYILHLSGVACTCNPDRPACLRHSAELCDCPNSRRVMFYRKSIAQLERLVAGVERASGKKHKASDKEKAFGAAKARQKRAAAWVKKAKDALAQRTPPTPLDQLEAIMIGAEEFTWAGEDMDDVRRVASKVSIAIAFQRELAVLKRRIAAAEDGDVDGRGGWTEPAVDDADIVAAAAAGAPMRVRRGGKYVNQETDQERELAARKAAEEVETRAAAAAAAAAGVAPSDADADDSGSGPASADESGAKKKEAPGVAPPRRMALTRLRELLDAAPFPLPPADAESFAKALADGEDLEKRVVAALAERPNPNPKRCVSLVAEVARGPLEVTSARRLKESVAAAHAWSEKVRKALPGRRHRPARADLPRLQDLAALRADAAELPVQPNDLSSLDAACEETTAWASRCSAFLATSSAAERSLDAAEELLREGLELPTSCDEVDQLEETVLAARHWVEETQKADESDAKIERLAELLERGGALEVTPEEVDALVERIRVREWADPAKRVAAGKPEPTPLAEIRAVVARGAAIIEGARPGGGGGQAHASASGKGSKSRKGAASGEPSPEPPVDEDHVTDFERSLLERLRANVASGEAWEKRAATLLKQAASGTLHPLDDVERAVKEAQAIPAAMEGYDELSAAASEARKWVEKAQMCLKGKQLTRRGAAAPLPTLQHAERLVRDAGKFIIAVKELALLEERVESAKEWGERADEATEIWREEGAETTLRELLIDHERFGLELPAAADVRACLAALEWEGEARDAIGLSGSPSKSPPNLDTLENLRERAEELDADDMQEGLVEEVNRRVELVEAWSRKVEDAIKGVSGEGPTTKAKSSERAAAEAKAAAEKRPTPETMRAFVEEGKSLPAIVPRVAELEAMLQEHETWVKAARKVLGPPKPEPTPEELAAAAEEAAAEAIADAEDERAAAIAAAEAEKKRARDKKKGKKKGKGSKAAAAAAAAATTTTEPVEDAESRARAAAKAKATMRRVADRLAALASAPDERPSMSDLVEIQAMGDSLPLKSEEGIELAAAVAAASSWSERLRKLLVRPRSSAGAHAVAVDDSVTALKIIVASVRAAIADLEGSGEPPESEEGQFCLCRQPGGREMLGCDKCGDWYHLRCAQVTANFARTAKHYVCPACCAADGDVFKLNKPDVVYRHIHRTKRPALAALGELFLEASSFSGVLPEEALLAEVFAAHDEWRAAVATAAERRAGVAGVESAAKAAKEKWDAAEAAAAVPRDARLARTKAVADRAAAVQQAQVLAGATAMAAALLGAGGGGTAATALEATQRCSHMPPEQQLEMLGQQVAAAAAIKQQQLVQLKGAVTAAAAAGLAGGDSSAQSVAAAAESSGPFEAMLIQQLQEIGTFVHQLATSQQQIQAQLRAGGLGQDAAAVQYQVLVQVMMLQQAYVGVCKQHDAQLDQLGSMLLEQQRVAAAAAAKAVEQDEEDDPDAPPPEPVEQKVEAAKAAEAGREAAGAGPEAEKEDKATHTNVAPKAEEKDAEPAATEVKAEPEGEPETPANAQTSSEPAEAPGAPPPKPAEAPPAPAPAAPPVVAPAVPPAPAPGRRKKAPEQPSEEELALAAVAASAEKEYEEAAAVFAAATVPSPMRQIFAGLKGAMAMEIEHDPSAADLLPYLLREVCGEAWRARARAALAPLETAVGAGEDDTNARFPTLATLTDLRETGVASGVIVPGGESPGPDPLGDEVAALEAAGQAWLDRAADAVDRTRDVPVEAVQALMEEGRALRINLKEELEELGERCEVYCLCKTAYDAARPMISCDKCEGWFHYECCGMCPPSEEEPEDADAHFTCPPCCEAAGTTYVPFRGPPKEKPQPDEGEGGDVDEAMEVAEASEEAPEEASEEAHEEASEESREEAHEEVPEMSPEEAHEEVKEKEPTPPPAPTGRGARRRR